MKDFLSKVLGYIKIGFDLELKARMMTAHNAAKSHNMLPAVDENNEIDYSRITLTYGKLPGAKGGSAFFMMILGFILSRLWKISKITKEIMTW